MKINRLKVENIRSYNSEEIIFPQGSVLLSGGIGSGKSSLLLAMEYALFGLQPGQKGTALLNSASDEGSVVIELEISGRVVEIERKLKRTPRGVSNDYSAITIDGEKVESSTTEVKTKVLSLLGYPAEFIKKNNLLYRYTVFTPQEQMKQIILEDPDSRLNLIRHIFGIDKYKRIKENLSLYSIKLREKTREIQGELKSLEGNMQKIDFAKEKIQEISKSIESQKSELSKLKTLEESINSVLGEIESKISEKTKLEREVEKLKILRSTKLESLDNLSEEIRESRKYISENAAEFSEQEYSSIILEIKEIQKRIDSLNAKYIDSISKINSNEMKRNETIEKKERIFKIDICPTCLQDVSENYKHNILNNSDNIITELLKENASLENLKEEIVREMDILTNKRKDFESKIKELDILKSKQDYIEKAKMKLSNLEERKSQLKKDLLHLDSSLEDLDLKIKNFDKYGEEHEEKESDLKSLKSHERSIEISLAELAKESELITQQLSDLKDKEDEKSRIEQNLTNVLELNDWLSTKFTYLIEYIERNTLMALRSEFSTVFKSWFRMLVTDINLEVQLDESFSPIVINSGAELEYSFLSGGERTAIALAYRLSLNQVLNSRLSKIKTKDLVILDEPTDGFSDKQIESLRDVLEGLTVAQLLIVSHEQKIESFVDHVIKIEKDQGGSRASNSNTPDLSESNPLQLQE